MKTLPLKIGVIGAGFTGLAAALALTKKGHEVTLFERENAPGGLTLGFKEKYWSWPLEKHYHHIFASDRHIIKLARQLKHKIIFKETTSSVFVDGQSFELDSPVNLLKFSKLSLLARFRTGITLLFLKAWPFWKTLERITAEKFLKTWMGKRSWKILWEPLFKRKFGKYYQDVPASWFWARIKKRSKRLGYPVRGFESLALSTEKRIKRLGGRFFYGTSINQIEKKGKKLEIVTDSGKKFLFDRVICTLPTPTFLGVTKGLGRSYKNKLLRLKGLGAVNLVLLLKKPFLRHTYWLNVNDGQFPFLGVMEQTNFMRPGLYGGDRIIYVGNYLEASHSYFQKSAPELLNEFLPYLKRINPNFGKTWVKKAIVFKAPFAQPIITLNYSRMLPELATPIKGLYLANIQQVYPWDRGTNYAVQLGERVARLVIGEQ